MGPHFRRQRPWRLQHHPPGHPRDGGAGLRTSGFLSSVSAERGGGVFGSVAYSAAKAAQLGFAKPLAREVGPHGITVDAVAPGLIDTDITGGALEGDTKTQLLAGIPVGRNGQVADVADVITFLCREQTGYITGATYDINGGSHMH